MRTIFFPSRFWHAIDDAPTSPHAHLDTMFRYRVGEGSIFPSGSASAKPIYGGRGRKRKEARRGEVRQGKARRPTQGLVPCRRGGGRVPIS